MQKILGNAFKYSVCGNKVHIVGTSLNNEYIIPIMDEDRGITEKQIQLIGDFIQFERSKYEQLSIGLGLSIAKKLINLYGGKFKIEAFPQNKLLWESR